MSIIAWDGYTIAADKAITNCDCMFTGTKINRLSDGRVLAWTGIEDTAKAMMKWYETGAQPEHFPQSQKDPNKFTRLIVATASGVWSYETEPFPLHVEDSVYAWGSGRDFALGAMAMGATARQAVEIASRYNIHCGMGIDEFVIKEKPVTSMAVLSGELPGPTREFIHRIQNERDTAIEKVIELQKRLSHFKGIDQCFPN